MSVTAQFISPTRANTCRISQGSTRVCVCTSRPPNCVHRSSSASVGEEASPMPFYRIDGGGVTAAVIEVTPLPSPSLPSSPLLNTPALPCPALPSLPFPPLINTPPLPSSIPLPCPLFSTAGTLQYLPLPGKQSISQGGAAWGGGVSQSHRGRGRIIWGSLTSYRSTT